ncbi:MAG: hypothetical protein ABIV13_01955 [Fimbriimonadales bacterium]
MLGTVIFTLMASALSAAPAEQNPWDLLPEIDASCSWKLVTQKPWTSVQDAPNAKGSHFDSKGRHFKVESVSYGQPGILDLGDYPKLLTALRDGDRITTATGKSGLLGARLARSSSIKVFYAYPLVDSGSYFVIRTYCDARVFECAKHTW